MIYSPSRVAQSSTTTGTGAFTLGSALTGARTAADAGIPLGALYGYTIEAVDSNGIPTGEWESGLGDLSASTTLNRRIVLAGSNGTSLVNFSAGTKYVYVAPLGELYGRGVEAGQFLFAETDLVGPPGAGTVEASMPWDFVVISSGTLSLQAGGPNHPGVVRITSSTTANSGATFSTHGTTAANAIQFRFGGGEFSQFIIRPQTLTNATIRFGFHDTTSSADVTDGAYFEMQPGGALVAKTANNSTRTTSSTLATLSTNTWYRGVIVVNHNASSVWFAVYSESGSLLGDTSITTNIPTASGREFGHGLIATNSGTTASALVDIDYVSVGIARRLTR